MEGGNSETSGGKPEAKSDAKRKRLLLRVGVIALAILVALIAWLATRDDGDDDSSTTPVETGPRIVSVSELSEAAASLGTPIYWVSEVPGTELELTELSEGGARVRYVPEGTEAGGGSSAVLSVSSYPLADPAAYLEGFAKRPGSIVREAGDGREVVSSEESPTSVYFASPDNSVQVEIYDPSAARAMSLALSGRVQPVP